MKLGKLWTPKRVGSREMTWTPAPSDDRHPKRLAELLGGVTRRLGLAAPDALSRVFAGWAELVGEPLASHVRPVGLRDQVLYLEVDESGWATQLRYLGDDLVRRIEERVGTGTVRTLSVKVVGPGAGGRRGGRGPSRRPEGDGGHTA